MGLIVTEKEKARQLERENEALKAENEQLKATVEYIAVCDYPEVFEDEEEAINE